MRRNRGKLHRLIAAAGLAAVCALVGATSADARPPQAHIVIDAASGQELLSSAPDQQVHPASLTKMMTLHLLFDDLAAGRIKLGSRVPFSRKAARRPPSKLGVPAGQSVSVKTAILALTVKSGNDVAVAVAERLSGSVEKFADRMNAKAAELGMARTHFVNPSGLHHRRQVSTPRDMAILARSLLYAHKPYYKYFKAQSFSHDGRTYRTHNRFVKKYQGADGLKTGFVYASGYNLAGSAVRDGRRLIGVVIGGRSSAQRDRKMMYVMDAGFKTARGLGKPLYAGLTAAAVDWRTGSIAAPPRRTSPIGQLVAMTTAGRAPSIVPAAAAATVSIAAARPEGDYAAQVGAVYSKSAAKKLAAQRLQSLGDTVSGGAPAVAALRLKSGKRLYRARISGLTDVQAEQACKELKRAGRDCLVVAEFTPG